MENYFEGILRTKSYINGIYVPWFHSSWFGCDIGRSVYHNYKKCFFNKEYIKGVFYNCKAIGFDMLKIWLNEQFEGILYDDSGSVIGIEPDFRKNFKTLLSIAKELGLNIGVCINVHQETYYSDKKFFYDKYMRYIYSPKETEKYINNWLNPILDICMEFDCVPLIDIYSEPEADACGWEVSRGFSWNSLVKFANRVNKAIKEKNPRFATTISSGAGLSTLKSGKYNGIDVDYLGADIYTSDGNFESTKNLMLDRALMLGEYGLSNYNTATETQQMQIIDSYVANTVKFGIKAIFYWCYGWKCKSAGEMHLVNSDGDLRKTAAHIHFYQLDRKNKKSNNLSVDKPVIVDIYTPRRISWFGSRNAVKYIIQRKNKGVFENIDEVAVLNNLENSGVFRCTDAAFECKGTYRVISVTASGDKIESDEVAMLWGE